MATLRRPLLLCCTLVFPAAGCAYESAACEGAECNESLGGVAQPAFVVGGFVPWALSNGQLKLCFKRDDSLTVAEFTAVKDRVMTVLNDTWGTVPGLDFVTGCLSPAMVLTLDHTAGRGSCGLGNGAACTIGADPANLPGVDAVAVHEIGHGLGLLHEHQRPDAAPLCGNEQAIKDGCTACSDGSCSIPEAEACFFAVPKDSSLTLTAEEQAVAAELVSVGETDCLTCSQGTCQIGWYDTEIHNYVPEQSYLSCFLSTPSDGTIVLTAEDRASAEGRVGDRTADGNGRVLTRYDPKSIMNYCSGVTGGRTDHVPTPLDLLGMEMVYSTNRTYGLGCGKGCFVTATGLVTSTSGSIVSEWIARGSQGVAFRVAGWPYDVYSYSVSGLAAGTTTVSYTFTDPVGRARSGGGTVKMSNAAYAALVSATAMIY